MSLLEDVFLQDEAGEAQELERIIEGDEYDERPRPTSDSDDNSEKEDEAEEDKRQVDPSSAKPKRAVKNPRFILNPARLTGPRGIQIIPEHFKDFKFKGKGYEKDDLDMVLKKLEHWAYRLYPKFQFEDCLKKIETLGKKRPVMVHLQKIRSDQLTTEEPVVQRESSDDEAPVQEEDEFDKLLQQQIELARATPAPSFVRKPPYTPIVDKSLTMPKATSSPSISEDQKQRMIRNRQLAEERRLARLKQASEHKLVEETNEKSSDGNDDDDEPRNSSKSITNSNEDAVNISKSKDSNGDELNYISKLNEQTSVPLTRNDKATIFTNEIDDDEDEIMNYERNDDVSKTKRSNVIDSSDDEDSMVMNETITVDVHENTKHSRNEINGEELDENETGLNNIEINDANRTINDNITFTRNEKDEDLNENDVKDQNDIDGNTSNVKLNSLNTNDEFNNDFLTSKSEVEGGKSTINAEEQSEILNQNSEINIDVENKNVINEFEVMDVDFSDDF